MNNGTNATAPNTYSNPSKMATNLENNLIDLTDEEDGTAKRVIQNGTSPPALVAIPNQGNKTVVGQGKVPFVTVKQNSSQGQAQSRGTTSPKMGNYGNERLLSATATMK